MQNHSPPYRAEHVGSLLRPEKLLDARSEYAAGTISEDRLHEIEDEAVREVVQMQEDLGFRAVTDGEYRRTVYSSDFLVKIGGVEQTKIGIEPKKPANPEGGKFKMPPPALRVENKLTRSAPIFVEHFKFLAEVAKETPKITIPSPSMLHVRGAPGVINQDVYPDMEDFYADLARIYQEELADLAQEGCRYVQLDEVNVAYLCDPELQDQVKANTGNEYSKLLRDYARLINMAISKRPSDMHIGCHLCRGNMQSTWGAEGGYEPVADVLFNQTDVDTYFLEYDDNRSGGFEPLRFLPKGKRIILGLVTSKRGAMESEDDLKRRIEEAATFAPIEQLGISPQCGFASVATGNRISMDDQRRKLELVMRVALDVWGEA